MKTPRVVALPCMYVSHIVLFLCLDHCSLLSWITASSASCYIRFICISHRPLYLNYGIFHRKTILNLVTLTYELDLDFLPLNLHAEIQARMFVRSAVRVRHTYTHTHRRTMPQLLHPTRRFADAGCKKYRCNI